MTGRCRKREEERERELGKEREIEGYRKSDEDEWEK